MPGPCEQRGVAKLVSRIFFATENTEPVENKSHNLRELPRHLRPALLDRWRESLGGLSERVRFLRTCDRAEFLGRLAAATRLAGQALAPGCNSPGD